jgi:hypothetical protein
MKKAKANGGGKRGIADGYQSEVSRVASLPPLPPSDFSDIFHSLDSILIHLSRSKPPRLASEKSLQTFNRFAMLIIVKTTRRRRKKAALDIVRRINSLSSRIYLIYFFPYSTGSAGDILVCWCILRFILLLQICHHQNLYDMSPRRWLGRGEEAKRRAKGASDRGIFGVFEWKHRALLRETSKNISYIP